jgi:hypothetical protein
MQIDSRGLTRIIYVSKHESAEKVVPVEGVLSGPFDKDQPPISGGDSQRGLRSIAVDPYG